MNGLDVVEDDDENNEGQVEDVKSEDSDSAAEEQAILKKFE